MVENDRSRIFSCKKTKALSDEMRLYCLSLHILRANTFFLGRAQFARRLPACPTHKKIMAPKFFAFRSFFSELFGMKSLLCLMVFRRIVGSELPYPDEEYISCECDTRVTTIEKNMTIHWGGGSKCVYGT